MAIRFELWKDGRLVGGIEAWWDVVERVLPARQATKYPLLSRVDPYGDVVFVRDELEPLAAELRSIAVDSPESLRRLVANLTALCMDGLTTADAELRLFGD